MRRIPLLFPFFLALFMALFGTTLLPNLKLMAFSPFLALLYNRMHFKSALWIASLCGLILDLLNSEFLLGLHGINFCLTTLLCFKQKKHFFEDKPHALCLFTGLISIVSTTVQLILISLFDRSLPISYKMLATDLICMPAFDALYAFIWFSCPMMVYLHVQRKGWRTYWKKLKSVLCLKWIKKSNA